MIRYDILESIIEQTGCKFRHHPRNLQEVITVYMLNELKRIFESPLLKLKKSNTLFFIDAHSSKITIRTVHPLSEVIKVYRIQENDNLTEILEGLTEILKRYNLIVKQEKSHIHTKSDSWYERKLNVEFNNSENI